jgi:pantoate--beta-alanine ligase
MLIATTPAEMHAACAELRRSNSLDPTTTLGLVPTMGALHAGHLSLVSTALAECDAVAVSIFVNPTQFGPNEDYAAYPRTFDEDCRKLEAAGVALLFAPSAPEMYPPGNTTFVDPGPIGDRLDGASRPGHFRGVATIVARLFHIVAPDRAYFGQKDAAQVAVLRCMVRDLNFPIQLAVCPIFREPDGLAMSSRNRYLSPAERQRALILSRALRAAESLALAGETSAETLRAAMLAVFSAPDPDPDPKLTADPSLASANPNSDGNAVPVRLDYAAMVDPDTLLPLADTSNGALVAVAAHIGPTRLIDNLLLPPATT